MQYIPQPYMQYCIDRMVSDEILALFLEPGLGKTGIALTAVNELKYNRFAVDKVLVIAPKKVAAGTWSREQQKWDHLHKLRIVTVLGTEQQRIRALTARADIYTINRENVMWLVDYYRNDWPFDMVIIDESTSFKAHDSKRRQSLVTVRPKIKRLVELTGTPTPNGLIDLWGQIQLLDGGERLGKYITHYRERYFYQDPYRPFTYSVKNDAEAAIYAKINDICVSMREEDYLQLPDCLIDDIPVELNAKAAKLYRELERKMLLAYDEMEINAGTAAILSSKLLQLCNGAVYDDNRNVLTVHDCKLEAFAELLEELNGQPALVFYYYQHDLARLEALLAKTKLRVRRLNTPQDEADWNARRIDVLLAHPNSASLGLNLQDGGNHVIWFSQIWQYEAYSQAIKRLHRQGQRQKVIVHRLAVAGGRDEDVLDALAHKGNAQDRLLDSLKVRIRKAKEG